MSARHILLFGIVLLAGCAETDPYRRPGMWQPEGANAANLAAMVELPSDLVRGRSDRTALTRESQGAVERLWEDRARPFPGQSRSSTDATGTANAGKEGS
ncbi:MAG: hypothetical protein JOZ05_07215 [Acetobacteraceae bacterium]|nr:hypothetical protein [Acetobacteraceae bacterium]